MIQPTEEEVEVLVAVEDLPPLSEIKASHVKQVRRAEAVVAHRQGYLIDPLQAVGKVLAREISTGQLITASDFLPDQGSPNWSIKEIPKGMQAFTVALPNSSVMSGLLYPHCRVDIYGVFDLKRREEGDALGTEILQAVEVLAVEYRIGPSQGTISEEKHPGRSNQVRVTFALTPDQVKALQLSLREGDICLALRNPQDEEVRAPGATRIRDGMVERDIPRSGDSDPSHDGTDSEKASSRPRTRRIPVHRGTKLTYDYVSGDDPNHATVRALSQ
jgi:Flp pilus assembly protein CpaB